VARHPKAAADALAKLAGGRSSPFLPLPGAYVCFLGKDWADVFVEFYPPHHRLIEGKDRTPHFDHVAGPEVANATHVNLSVHRSLEEIARVADELGLRHGLRMNFVDVWLEDELLFEIAPH